MNKAKRLEDTLQAILKDKENWNLEENPRAITNQLKDLAFKIEKQDLQPVPPSLKEFAVLMAVILAIAAPSYIFEWAIGGVIICIIAILYMFYKTETAKRAKK